jgi:hypothetical protein
MQGDQLPERERFVRHPIHATEHEAAHLRDVAEEGVSPATPAILAGAVLLVVVPLAAILMVLAFEIPHVV